MTDLIWLGWVLPSLITSLIILSYYRAQYGTLEKAMEISPIANTVFLLLGSILYPAALIDLLFRQNYALHFMYFLCRERKACDYIGGDS